MKLLATITDHDIDRAAPEVDAGGFRTRGAARAVVFDGPKVALLHVTKDHYFKLPGGGIEPGEDQMQALDREILEEIGCHIKVTGEVGHIIEYRAPWQLAQTSYCYTAVKVGEAQAPNFTADEQGRGFEIVWADNLDAAIKLVKDTGATDYEGPFIAKRDSLLLESARTHTIAS